MLALILRWLLLSKGGLVLQCLSASPWCNCHIHKCQKILIQTVPGTEPRQNYHYLQVKVALKLRWHCNYNNYGKQPVGQLASLAVKYYFASNQICSLKLDFTTARLDNYTTYEPRSFKHTRT